MMTDDLAGRRGRVNAAARRIEHGVHYPARRPQLPRQRALRGASALGRADSVVRTLRLTGAACVARLAEGLAAAQRGAHGVARSEIEAGAVSCAVERRSARLREA